MTEILPLLGLLSLAANVYLGLALRKARLAIRVLCGATLAPYEVTMQSGYVIRLNAVNAYAEGSALYVVDADDRDLLVLPWDYVSLVRARGQVLQIKEPAGE